MPARLVALNGTTDIPLSGLLIIIGRHPDCDVRLDSSRVSRRHCCLALGNGELLVRDLGSTNGTRVNGRKIGDGVLRAGDFLEIAHLCFRLDVNNSAESSRPSDPPRRPDPNPPTPARGTTHDTAPHDPKRFAGKASHPDRPGGE
jgi:pSer/pThr/pTyr-binding forkhead associated (FHA) protein